MLNNSAYQFTQVKPGDPILNAIAREVSPADINSQYIQKLIDFMLELAAGKGHSKKDSRQMVGLAAPQVGAGVRVITIDFTADGSNKQQSLEVFINPVITQKSDKAIVGREGCWSCDNVCGIVERAESLAIAAQDRNGKPIKRKFDGFIARIAQHEVDHLDGIRFPDRIPTDKPENLHWVKTEEFEKYRNEWMNWPVLCPRERWEAIKNGN